MSKSTSLAESQVTQSSHDVVDVQLVEPADLPAFVQISLPAQPSIVDPTRFGDTAAALVRMFSTAHVELARIKSRRHR
jgi:hypothetical protein